jgi:iron-sulfur cluster assembly accessory protein
LRAHDDALGVAPTHPLHLLVAVSCTAGVERSEGAERVGNTNLDAGGCRNRLRCVRLRKFSAPPRSRRAAKELDSMIEQQPTVLSLSDAAAMKLRELTKEETNPNIGLRVYVYSGGCSGFRYGMMLEDQPTPEDNILDVNGTKVYVDGQSIPLLQGSEIDYVDTLMGAGFTVNNPNAVAACGCGSSFRTADDAGTARSCAH